MTRTHTDPHPPVVYLQWNPAASRPAPPPSSQPHLQEHDYVDGNENKVWQTVDQSPTKQSRYIWNWLAAIDKLSRDVILMPGFTLLFRVYLSRCDWCYIRTFNEWIVYSHCGLQQQIQFSQRVIGAFKDNKKYIYTSYLFWLYEPRWRSGSICKTKKNPCEVTIRWAAGDLHSSSLTWHGSKHRNKKKVIPPLMISSEQTNQV